jgi:hypothetical protein
MSDIPRVIRAEYEKEYRIRLTFDDGVTGSVDFRPWLVGPVFEPLLDASYFCNFRLDGGTVAWPNGADIAPETLYVNAKASRAA